MKSLIKTLLQNNQRAYSAAAKSYNFTKAVLRATHEKESRNWLKCFLSAAVKSPYAFGRPTDLTIEPTNVCDQKCTICETGLGILERPPQHMHFDQFKTVLDQFDESLRSLTFYFMGESFLNKDAYKMIRYATDKGIRVSACTNCNRIDPEKLVASGIADIQFQIAGTTPEVHALYRVGGDLDKALENLKKTLILRNAHTGDSGVSPFGMNVGLGFILLRPNEHQVDAFVELAESLGVDEHQIIDPCVRTVEQGRELMPTDKSHWVYDPLAFERGELKMRKAPNNRCDWLYGSVTIQVSGDVVPCCRDPKGHWVLGNVFVEDIYSIWNGDKYKQLRRQVASNQGKLPLCSLCSGYDLPGTAGK